MNNTHNSDLIDEMVEELERSRITTQTQKDCISDICEKSNNILLQIEASQKAKSLQENVSAARYKYCKETLYALAKTIEIFERLMNKDTTTRQCADFEVYITKTKSKIDFLANAVRKLLALNDTVNQIGCELHNDSDDCDLDSSGTCEANSSE